MEGSSDLQSKVAIRGYLKDAQSKALHNVDEKLACKEEPIQTRYLKQN